MKRSKSWAKAVEKKNVNKTQFTPVYSKLVCEESVVNDRVLKSTTFKDVDLAEARNGWKVSDFYLENVIAAGAVGMLNDTSISNSPLNEVDNITRQLEGIEIPSEE